LKEKKAFGKRKAKVQKEERTTTGLRGSENKKKGRFGRQGKKRKTWVVEKILEGRKMNERERRFKGADRNEDDHPGKWKTYRIKHTAHKNNEGGGRGISGD